jgi:hypothetical protein
MIPTALILSTKDSNEQLHSIFVLSSDNSSAVPCFDSDSISIKC